MATVQIYPGGPQADPFGPMPEQAVREYVATIGLQVTSDPRVRVEVIFDSPEGIKYGMKKPFAEFMVGLPDTQIRVYRSFALPTWATPSQIAGLLLSELKFKAGSKWDAFKRFYTGTNTKLVVKGAPGLYEVSEFSAAKRVN